MSSVVVIETLAGSLDRTIISNTHSATSNLIVLSVA
jgi:hypothetical protein